MKAIILSAVACMACAANAAGEAWSLDSCINYAQVNNISVRQRALDCMNAEYGVIEAKDRFLPSVSGGAQQSFSFGRGLTAENTYANRNTQNFGVNAGMNMPLFQGLAGVRRLDYAKANLQAVLEQYEATKDDVTLNVIAQYLQVLYCKEMLEVSSDQVELSQKELERRKVLLDAGKIAELDVLEAEAQLARDRLTETNADNDYRLALVAMTRLLMLPDADNSFEVMPLGEDENLPLPSVESVYARALQFNHGVNAASLAVKAAERNVSLVRTGYMPTLSLNAGLSTNYYKVSGLQGGSFGTQLRDNFSKSIGLTLSVPIFDAFGTRNNIRRAKTSQLSAELQLDDVRSQLYQNIRQAHSQALAARRKLASSEVAFVSSFAALAAMEEKYNYGRANSTEFEQAKSAWFRARSEMVQARYESILRTRIVEFYNK